MKPMRFPEFSAELLRLYQPPHRAPATRRQIEFVLNILAELGVATTADLTAGMVAQFIETRPPGHSTRTMFTYLRVLRVICNFAHANAWLKVSPFVIRPMRSWIRLGPPAPKKWFPADAINRVLELMKRDCEETLGWAQWRSRRIYCLTAVVAYCGLRAKEAQTLWADDVRLADRCILITDRCRSGGLRLKTEGSAAPVPIPGILAPILEDWMLHRMDAPADFKMPENMPWMFPGTKRRGPWLQGCPGTKPIDVLHSIAERAGVPGFTFKSLRASWATKAENSGMSALTIQRVLRHSNDRTQLWYRAADIASLAQAVNDFHY
jgi:integrase